MGRRPGRAAKNATGNLWRCLEDKLRDIERAIQPFTVPSEGDWERYALSILTYGKIKSPFKSRLGRGEWAYAMNSDRRQLLESMSYEMRFTDRLPTGWPGFMSHPEPINIELIRSSIEQETANLEFIVEWGRFNQWFGRYLELIHNSERSSAEIEEGISGKVDGSTLMQRHWYARWMKQRCESLKPKHRARAENDLAALCHRIATRNLAPSAPYPSQWFSSMLISEQGEPGESLKSTYTRITVSQISELLASTVVEPRHLPPLSADAYTRR